MSINFRLGAMVCVIPGLLTAGAAHAVTLAPTQFLTGTAANTEVLNLSTAQALAGNSSYQFNTINDTTGTKLVTDNGDAKDFTLKGTSTAGTLGTARVTLSPTGAFGRVRDDHGFAGAPSVNNPGSVNANTFTLLFNSNLSVTNATFNFSSLNTAGISWEYSVIQLLDSNGNAFSPLTPPSWILGGAGQYASAGAGYTGAAGLGNYIAASTGTVTGVGGTTASGSNGSADNIGSFNYGLVGLSTGTQIGGVRWTTYLEDVRGKTNGNSNFTSSLLDFTISGNVVPVPEPSGYLMFAAAGALLFGLGKTRRV